MKIVTAKFTDDRDASVYGVSQWDYGQILRIEGLKLPKMVEIHFSLEEKAGEALTRIGVTKDGVTDVVIPDSMLENEGAIKTYEIYAWVYLTDADSGSTEYKITIHVKARSKPEIPGGGDNPDIFHEAVLAVRESAKIAEEAQKQAEGYAHGREDLPERAEDNAMYYAGKAAENAEKTAEDRKEVERLVESVSGINEQVDKVEKLSKEAQEAATQAGTSAEAAETHKQAAETASSAAQAAAEKTEEDKVSVEKTKETVQNLSTQVQKNKESVDKTTQDFALTAQQALTDVNNAGQTQTERVQTAGATAVEDVQTARNTATGVVETAKSEAIQAVQTEGNKQVQAVMDKGQEVLESIPEDFPVQMETKLDKNQGVENAGKALVVGEDGNVIPGKPQAEGVGDAADAIVNTATGNLLLIKDSAERKIRGFGMSGKTEQASTTGKNLFNIPDIDANMQEKEVKIECNITQAITISVQKEATVSNYIWRFRVKYKDGTLRYLNDNEFPKTFDATEENPIIEITYRKVYITSGAYTGIMVEHGTTATAYEPYTGGKPSPSPEYPQKIISAGDKGAIEVKVTGKNLLPFPYPDIKEIGKTISHKGVAYTVLQDGGVHLKGTAEDAFGLNICQIQFKKYGEVKTSDVIFYDPNNDKTFFYFNGYVGKAIDMVVYPQLECGTVATSYEPYRQPQTLILTSDRPLRKWDRLVEQDGQIGWLYKSSTITFDGKPEENWKVYNNKAFSIEIADANLQKSFCDKYKHKSGAWSEPDFCIYSDNGYPQKYFRPPYEEFEMNVDTWKTFLNKNPLTVVYETLTTEFVPLPKEQQDAIRALSTYYPNSVVTNSEDMEMELSYVADTKNFILGIAENFAQKQLETNRLILERTI